MILIQPEMLWLLALVPVIAVVFQLRLRWQRRDVARFGVKVVGRFFQRQSLERWRLGLLVLAIIFMVLALTRPAVNPHAKLMAREGRDVVFLLDVSNSMLAADRLPNRLESAKASIAECVDSLGGHRVGLVVFAGSSSILCPLTTDKKFLLARLEGAGPGSVAHGGTLVGDALLKVCDKLFSESGGGYKDIILLSDGGDQSAGLDLAVKELNEKQVHLLSIGLGDVAVGARIPDMGVGADGGFIMHQGREVWSKLEGGLLSDLVKRCDRAAYIPVGTRKMQLSAIYKKLSEKEGVQKLAEESVIVYDEIFHWFILASLSFLVMMVVVPHVRRRPLVAAGRSWAVTALLGFGALHLAASEVLASDAFADANQLYRDGQFEKSLELYEQALREEPGAERLRAIIYNRANAYYKVSEVAESSYVALEMVEESIQQYRLVLEQDRNDRRAAQNNEIARRQRKVILLRLKMEEKLRQEMQAALDAIRKLLVECLAEQTRVLAGLDEGIPADESWERGQCLVMMLTREIEYEIAAYNATYFPGVDEALTPMKDSKAHVDRAIDHQDLSVLWWREHWGQAFLNGAGSQRELAAALQMMPKDAQATNSKDGDESEPEDGDNKDESEEGDESEGEPGDGEAAEDSDGSEMEAGSMDFNANDLPPPSNSPEDVIRMSERMQQSRQSQKSKNTGKGVEKNW